jgi:hypothetical protein
LRRFDGLRFRIGHTPFCSIGSGWESP